MTRHLLSLVPERSISTWPRCVDGAAFGERCIIVGPAVAVDP